jgi:hypothetical protein
MSSGNQELLAAIRPMMAAATNGQQAMVLAELTATWLAEHPPETWDTLMTFQASTVQALARLEIPARRTRRKSGSGDAAD